MAHQRKLIRDAVVAALKAGNRTPAGQRVYPNRSSEIFANEIPCICVYTRQEGPPEVAIEAPRQYKRTVQLTLECIASADNPDLVDDKLDEFAESIEKLMFVDETFGGVASETYLGETEIVIPDEQKKTVGAIRMSFTLVYYQDLPAAPDGELDDYLRSTIEIDPAPTDTVPHEKSTDEIELPQ